MLQDTFQKKSWFNNLQLQKKPYRLRLNKGDSVQNHVKEMMETFQALSIVGDNVTEEDKVVRLPASLPDSCNTLITAVEASICIPPVQTVRKLLHEERNSTEAESQ